MTRTSTYRRLVGSLLLGASLGATGCSGILDEVPPHRMTTDNLFTDQTGYELALNGLYSTARLWAVGVGGGGFDDLRSAVMISGTDAVFGMFDNDNLSKLANRWGAQNNSTSGYWHTIWTWLYQMVNAANQIIDRIDEVPWSSQADRDRTLAEARLLRAWSYRHLTYLWGDVPLVLTEITGVKTDWERASKAQVLEQIEEDLLFASEHLDMAPANDIKVSRAVALHYLAENYLRQGEPAKAEAAAAEVVNSGVYRLVDARYGVKSDQPGVPFSDMFIDGNVTRSQGNTEALWVFEFQKNVVGGSANYMRRTWVPQYHLLSYMANPSVEGGGRGQGRMGPTSWALSIYEPQDDRFDASVVRKGFVALAGPHKGEFVLSSYTPYDSVRNQIRPDSVFKPEHWTIRKWDSAEPENITNGASYNDVLYLRLADTYLLLAEAQLKQGKLPEAAATINRVRARSHASPIDAGQVTLDFLLDERSRELVGEEERRYTLLRQGGAKLLERVRKYNGVAASTIAERDTIYPIPQAVIDANTGAPMAQNPGY
jgi:hypothetical protein